MTYKLSIDIYRTSRLFIQFQFFQEPAAKRAKLYEYDPNRFDF